MGYESVFGKYSWIIVYVIMVSIHVFFIHYVEDSADAYYENRINMNKTRPKVYDIGHKYIPDLSHVKELGYLNDALVLVLPAVFGTKVVSEFVVYAFPVFIVRHIFNSITILPKHKNCDTKDIPMWKRYITGGCYDKIFSGHFASLFLLTLILASKGYDIRVLGALNFLHAMLILSIRTHYTIDIVVAVVVVYTIYQIKFLKTLVK
jgi:hypothetical protein